MMFFYMSVRHLPISLLLLTMVGGSYLALLSQPALFLVVPGVVTWAASAMIEPLLVRHMPKDAEASEREDD